MTTTTYYDVVVVGMQLPALSCAALVAKRGFRVLVIGHDDLGPEYELADMTLPRAPFTFLAAQSPATGRVLSELALYQELRRRAATMDPALQISLPGHRMDMPGDPEGLAREVAREFPSVRRPINDFHRRVASAASEFDAVVERDLVWPPETFLERRELARASAYQQFDRRGVAPDPLAELTDSHPFRLAVKAPVSFADRMDPERPNALRLIRNYGSWLRAPVTLRGGYAALRAMLLQKINTHGGEVRPQERAGAITTHRGRATGVRLEGSGQEIGCAFVTIGCFLSTALGLLANRRPFEELFERIGEPTPRYFRYTLNVVVRAEGLPEAMARNVIHVRDTSRPLCGPNMLRIEARPEDALGRRLLSTDLLVPRRGVEEVPGYMEGLREEVLGTLGDLLPFLQEHILWVDSPHDGRDALDFRAGRLLAPDRPWSRGPATMEPIFGYPVTGALGVCALPVRTPVRGLLLCNHQVVPGLGQEGDFMAARSAARIISRSDRKKAWMRRGLWTKVDF